MDHCALSPAFLKQSCSLIRSRADYLSLRKKKKHGNFFKNWPCPNFSCCPKNLSYPKFRGAGGGFNIFIPRVSYMSTLTCILQHGKCFEHSGKGTGCGTKSSYFYCYCAPSNPPVISCYTLTQNQIALNLFSTFQNYSFLPN